MLSPLILPLSTARPDDYHLMGHKAANLCRMMQAGFPVPSGVVLTTQAFELALGHRLPQISHILNQKPFVPEMASQKIDGLLADIQIPDLVIATLKRKLEAEGLNQAKYWALRSSALSEDGPQASFAGQYESYLGVANPLEDDNPFRETLSKAWRAFYSPHALAARATQGKLDEVTGLALLLQVMINADCAGVCFSLDPVAQNAENLLVNAHWGLGSSIVDGQETGDSFWIRREDLKLTRHHLAQKQRKQTLNTSGDFEEVFLAEDEKDRAVLAENWLKHLASFGRALEQFFGGPQDIEWAIAENKLWLLQSRPITALSSTLQETVKFPLVWQDETEGREFWRRRQPDGFESDILKPLEQDIFLAVESMREETCKFMGVEKNMAYKICQGYVYERPVPLDISPGDLRLRRQARKDLMKRLWQLGWNAWDYWGPEVETATARLRDFDPEQAADQAIADHLDAALAARRRHYMLHPMCVFKPMPSYFQALAKLSGLQDDALESLGYQLLDGETNPLTVLVDQLYELAQLAMADSALKNLLVMPPPDIKKKIAALPENNAFKQKFLTLLAEYGERVGNGYGSEVSLTQATWRENPAILLKLAAIYLDPNSPSPIESREKAHQQRQNSLDELYRACADSEIIKTFQSELKRARHSYAVLEIHNHYIDQMSVGQLRHALLYAGARLCDLGFLSEVEAIFWLRWPEIQALLRQDRGFWADLSSIETNLTLSRDDQLDLSILIPQLIIQRQTDYTHWQTLQAPPVLGLPRPNLPTPDHFPGTQSDLPKDGTNQLFGLGASPGQATGRVHLALGDIDLPQLNQGDILVTENIGPRWTPLMPLLGGIVLDKGSLGQHAAATAREYGVPAVVATQNATQRIPHDAWLHLDGRTGAVSWDND